MKKRQQNYLKDDIATFIFTNKDLKEYVRCVINEVIKNSKVESINHFEKLELLSERVYNNNEIIKRKVDAIYETDTFIVNFEFNYKRGESLNRKNLSYVALIYNKNFINNNENKDVKRNIQINIDNYDYFGRNEFLYESGMMEKKHHLIHNDYSTIFNINMAYLKNLDYNKIVERDQSLEKLLYILVCPNKKDRNKLCKDNEIMKKVNDKIINYNDKYDNLFFYDPEEILKQDSFDAGKAEGVLQNKQEIAKKMLDENMSLELIQKITNLTENEILSLKEK